MPRQLIVADRPSLRRGRLSVYLVINSRLGGDFAIVTPRTVPILQRAFTLNQQSALLSLVSTSYLYARGNGVDYNLSFIGNEVPLGPRLFDTGYMRRLYAYGLERGRTGDFWRKRPPDAAEQSEIEDAGSD